MDPARKQLRVWIASVTVGLVFVCGAWLIMHSDRYRTYVHETKLRETLETIAPPEGAKVLAIKTYHYESYAFATGLYSADTEFDKVKTHYIQEFPRHGFVYKGDFTTKDKQTGVRFCAPNYNAILGTLPPEVGPQSYGISIDWTDTPC